MRLVFLETPLFTRHLGGYLSDESYRELQRSLMENPCRGRAGCQEANAMKQKRKLFDELMEGLDAMRQHREGKITLRSYESDDQPPLEVDAQLIRDTRERMNVSRAVFARRLRVSARTLENWEQGRARPNAQAAALILMVRKFPDTLEKLSELGDEAA
jgi:putative transcriptional regulator